MNGTNLPESIKILSKNKNEVTLFVDGDRGGNLIIKNVINNAKIDFIAMAPEGKEVEELTDKEILQSLRKKIRVEEYNFEQRGRGVRDYEGSERFERKKITESEKEEIKEKIEEITGTKSALVFNKNLEIIKRIPIRKLSSIRLDENPYIIAIDGTATKKIIENCENLNCHNLIASNFISSDTELNLESM